MSPMLTLAHASRESASRTGGSRYDRQVFVGNVHENDLLHKKTEEIDAVFLSRCTTIHRLFFPESGFSESLLHHVNQVSMMIRPNSVFF